MMRCDGDLAGVVRAWWCKKHWVEAIELNSDLSLTLLLLCDETNYGSRNLWSGLSLKFGVCYLVLDIGYWILEYWIRFSMWDKVIEALIGATSFSFMPRDILITISSTTLMFLIKN